MASFFLSKLKITACIRSQEKWIQRLLSKTNCQCFQRDLSLAFMWLHRVLSSFQPWHIPHLLIIRFKAKPSKTSSISSCLIIQPKSRCIDMGKERKCYSPGNVPAKSAKKNKNNERVTIQTSNWKLKNFFQSKSRTPFNYSHLIILHSNRK